jgi:hypothetical protein
LTTRGRGLAKRNVAEEDKQLFHVVTADLLALGLELPEAPLGQLGKLCSADDAETVLEQPRGTARGAVSGVLIADGRQNGHRRQRRAVGTEPALENVVRRLPPSFIACAMEGGGRLDEESGELLGRMTNR